MQKANNNTTIIKFICVERIKTNSDKVLYKANIERTKDNIQI